MDTCVTDAHMHICVCSQLCTLQRTFVGVDAFKVFQEVLLLPDEPRVCNVVEFGTNIGYLRVEAEASIETKPLPNFTPR